MKYLACLLLALSACATNPETGQLEFDSRAAGAELALIAGDLRAVTPQLADAGLAESLGEVALVLEQIGAALESGGDADALAVSIDLAQAAIASMLSRNDLSDGQFLALAVADGILRRIEVYAL